MLIVYFVTQNTWQDVFHDVLNVHWHGNLLVGTYFAFCLACRQHGLGQA